jgi:hypothetical protein
MRPPRLAIAFALAVVAFSVARYIIGPGALAFALLLGAFGVLALLIALVALAKARTRPNAYSALVILGAWAAWLFLPTDIMGVHAKFWLERASYEAAVAQIAVGREPTCVRANVCRHEAGSSMPLAFPWEGIIDNWVGVVYDPTGTVIDAARYRGIFGGDLVGCSHISGPYFLCSFT